MTLPASFAVMMCAVLLDALLGEPRRWHPLVGFGVLTNVVERSINPAARSLDVYVGGSTHIREVHGARALRARGACALLLLLAPPIALCALLVRIPGIGPLISVATLYLCIGHRSLREHAMRVHAALLARDLRAAQSALARMVSRDTAGLDARGCAAATVESVLENGSDAVFGSLFWFLLLGAPGALMHRLANTLDAMWGYHSPRYLQFGWAAARFDDLLNLVPARLTALGYALCGATHCALRCWHLQASHWDSPNAGPVMAAGAGSLRLRLGGPAQYRGQLESRPRLGTGCVPQIADIPRSLALLLRTLILWLLVMAASASASASLSMSLAASPPLQLSP